MISALAYQYQGDLIKTLMGTADRGLADTSVRRFIVESAGKTWIIYDRVRQMVVVDSSGELDSRVIACELMNRHWDRRNVVSISKGAKQCQK